MPLDQIGKSLWTPDGEKVLREKDVITVTDAMERVTFARMHEYAQRYGLALICQRCDTAIQGKNSGHEAIPAVACACREFRFVR